MTVIGKHTCLHFFNIRNLEEAPFIPLYTQKETKQIKLFLFTKKKNPASIYAFLKQRFQFEHCYTK